MAVQLEKSAGTGEVSNCVSNLIHAFTDGLNVFRRLRERRRKRKSRQKERDSGDGGAPSSAELQLSNSLRKGPVELRERYMICYGDKGEPFAKGDEIAHASLAKTLIRLNTGLVRIIATFLHQDSKSNDFHLDYKSLTSLSDLSRREAIESLNQLHQRLSQSQLQLHRTASHKTEPEKKRRSSSRQRSQGPTVTRVPVKSTTQTQLAMVRPRNVRKGSSSSGSTGSSKAPSTAASSRNTTPPRSPPLPQYSAKDPFPPHKAPVNRASNSTAKKTTNLTDGPRPTTWPQPKTNKSASFNNPLPTPPEHSTMQSLPPHLSPPVIGIPRRRIDKLTQSTYTFASDSTKLGEIPQRNWIVPWNDEEAERLNAEAAVKGYPVAMAPGEPKTKTRKGLRSLFKKGGAQAA